MKKVNVKIPEHWVVTCNYYPYFDDAKHLYKLMGINVKYHGLVNLPPYKAVFYVNKKPIKYINDLESVQKML